LEDAPSPTIGTAPGRRLWCEPAFSVESERIHVLREPPQFPSDGIVAMDFRQFAQARGFHAKVFRVYRRHQERLEPWR
jgi:hypothetical protein